MRQLSRWTILFLLLLTAGAMPAAARAQEEPAPLTTIRYEIRYMDLHAAEALAWEQCPAALKPRCRVAALASGGDPHRKAYLEVMADAATHERIAKALVKADSMPRTQVFQLVLLAAGSSPGGAAPALSVSAQKALDDLRGFLPYKRYEVLDTAWFRATQDDVTEARVRGLGGASYRLQFRFRMTGAIAEGQLFVDAFQLAQEPGIPRPPAAKESEQPAPTPRPSRDLISTSFGLKIGETLVVGASKVDGAEDALVVLLTAIPEGGRG